MRNPQTGEICWNNPTFLKSAAREEGQFKVSLFKWNPNKEGKQILSIIYDQNPANRYVKYVALIQVQIIWGRMDNKCRLKTKLHTINSSNKQLNSNSKLDQGLLFHWLGWEGIVLKKGGNWVDLIWRQQGTAVHFRSDSWDWAEKVEKVEKSWKSWIEKFATPTYQLLPPLWAILLLKSSRSQRIWKI